MHGMMNRGRPLRPLGERVLPGSRRGGVYVLVLVVTTTVSAMALLGLKAAMSAKEEGRRVVDSISARQLAASAIEMGMHTIETEPDWRLARAEGVWVNKEVIGTGTASVKVEAVGGGAYTKSCWDPIELSGYGYEGSSRSILRVQLTLRGESSRDHAELLAAKGPLGYWPIDGIEGGGYEADAAGGNPLVKAWTGSEVTPGMVPGLGEASAPWFAGVAGSMEAKSAAEYSGIRTVSVWFWVSSTAGLQGIVTRDAAGRGLGGRWELAVNAGALEALYDTSDRTVTLSGGVVQEEQWNHALLTVSDAGVRLYLNGTRVDQWSSAPLADELAKDAPSESILIGVSRRMGATTAAGSDPIRGSVCELVVLSADMSDAEVLSLYNAYPAPAQYKVVTDSWERVIE